PSVVAARQARTEHYSARRGGMRGEISAARNDYRRASKSVPREVKRSNQRGSTLPQMTEVTRIPEQKGDDFKNVCPTMPKWHPRLKRFRQPKSRVNWAVQRRQ